MSTLMESVNNWITPELTSSLASRFGITAPAAQSAVKTSAAAILTGIASRATDSGFIGNIFRMLTGSAASASSAAAVPAETASNFLSTIFGGSLSAVEGKIAQAANIPSSAASAVMASAAPAVMGALSSKINAGGMTAASFGSWMASELASLKSHLPGGFVLPGLASVGAAAGRAESYATSKVQEAESKSGGWLWPVLLLGALLIGGLIWYFNRPGAKEQTATVADTTTQAMQTATTAVVDKTKEVVSALGAFFKKKLPDGTELNIPENGVENHLISFIDDKSKLVDKETWFDFDRLLFATGSANLEASSDEQLKNVAAILKAYPNVHMRIGGYTDNTGDAAANLKLSEARATNVMHRLVELGVAANRLDAKGYGEEHPVADNATEEGRQKNRRISMRVTAK